METTRIIPDLNHTVLATSAFPTFCDDTLAPGPGGLFAAFDTLEAAKTPLDDEEDEDEDEDDVADDEDDEDEDLEDDDDDLDEEDDDDLEDDDEDDDEDEDEDLEDDDDPKPLRVKTRS